VITLFTGVPGAGKTLYALNYVKAFAEKHGRPVFYSGIANLTLPWTLFGEAGDNADKPYDTDASSWDDLPDGSIIVIDECQRLYRPRGTGSAVPKYVSALETHRHRGLDIFLITQHPMLIDSNVRRLIGQHFHVVRLLGLNRATVHEYPSATEISKSALLESVRHEFSYPKESFAWYKSAEVHTHQKRIPMRVFIMLAAPLVIGALLWFGYTKVAGFWSPKSGLDAAAEVKGVIGTRNQVLVEVPAWKAAHLSTADYIEMRAPRLVGLPHTAPVYDEVTKPTRAPVPAACVGSVSQGCRCFTQDATRIDMDEGMCRTIVARGYFLEFNASPAAPGSQPSENNVGTQTGAGPQAAAGAGGLPSAPAMHRATMGPMPGQVSGGGRPPSARPAAHSGPSPAKPGANGPAGK